MAEFRILQGILALVDIVNFTGQATKLGENYTAQYTVYFQEKIKTMAENHGFQVVKSMGDALLLFGADIEGLMDIMLDLFHRDKPEDRFGFKSRFRMVAHSGFFQFQMKENRPVDLVSPEGIKVFRMEKNAQTWELVVTPPLYQGIKPLLTQKNIEASRFAIDEPFKGFDNEEWSSPFYRLRIAREQAGVTNLLEYRMNELEKDVQYIPVFGNIYPQVPMEQNFINLSMVYDDESGGEVSCFSKEDEKEKGKKRKEEEAGRRSPWDRKREWPYFEMEMAERSSPGFKEIDVHTLYEKYCKGVIFGLPGAGKTTFLRNLAFKEFKANDTKTDNQKQVILFVPCRQIPLYDEWYRRCYGTAPAEPDPEAVLEFMTWVFLFGGKDDYEISPDQRVEFQNAGQKVKRAFNEKRLTLLVDALDEASDINTREQIKQLFLIVHRDPRSEGNRLYLTSRPSETIHFTREFIKENIPVFRVLNLNMEQVRAVARQLMEPGSDIYKKFDQAIWKEEIVVKMAATPITALLVTAYFQAYEKFDHRYPMYDLLLKFILLKVWDNIKTGTFPFKNLELFFQEIRRPGFFDRHKETRIFYDALASLCFDLFYGDVDGIVQRSVNEDTLMMYFTRFIRENLYYYDEETAQAEAAKWRERFHRDHLLVQAGRREYVFVHSTFMEFLAAHYMVQEYHKNNKNLLELVRKSVVKETFLDMETLPIAAGSSLLTGYEVLAHLRDLLPQVTYSGARFLRQGIKCLAEVEWLLYKTFQAIRIERLRSPIMDIVNRNRKSVLWVYKYLEDTLLTEDKEQLNQQVQQFENPLKLSQKTFFDEHLDYEAFDKGDSELVGLRTQLLYRLVQKEVVEQWLKDNKKTRQEMEEEYENVLQLDSPGYHPEDKNFNYFRNMIGNELMGFFGSPNLRHLSFVLYCVFSPDGKFILSVSRDNTLKLWDSSSGKEIRIFHGHKSTVWSCAFSPDGKTILSASDDKTLKLWDAESGKEIRTYSGYSAPVISCTFSPGGDRILSSSLDNTLKLWDMESGKEICVFTGHSAYVLSCAFSPDGTLILSASRDSTLKLWDVESGKEIRTFTGHKDYIRECAFSPEGKQIISASMDTTLKLWDVATGEEIRTFSGHKAYVESCGFSPDGKTLVSASWDTTLKLWNVATGKEIRSFSGHSSAVYSCGFSPDGQILVSASGDNTLKLWDVSSGKEIRSVSGHKDTVRGCGFSPDGKTLVSASEDNTLKLWDVAVGKEIRSFSGHKDAVWGCGFSPDGKTLVSASGDTTLKLWDLAVGKEIRSFRGHKDAVWGCVFSPDGKTLVSASSDHTLKLWDVAVGKEICFFSGHENTVYSCVFSPGGKTMVSASSDNTLKLWDVAVGKEIRSFRGHKDAVWGCVFSPDGKTLVSASSDHTLKLWDVATGQEIRSFSGHKDVVSSCGFLLNGQTLVSVSSDQTLKLWDVATGKEIHSVKLPWRPFYVAVSPTNPNLVITANANGTVTMFEFEEISK